MVLNEVEKGKMVIREAAEMLGISERQGWRIFETEKSRLSNSLRIRRE